MKKEQKKSRIKARQRKTRLKRVAEVQMEKVRLDEFSESRRGGFTELDAFNFTDALILVAIMAIAVRLLYGTISDRVKIRTDRGEAEALYYRPDFSRSLPAGFYIPPRLIP